MKVLVVIFMVVATTAATLVSYDEVEDLFKKFVSSALTQEEAESLQDVFEILRFPDFATARSFRSFDDIFKILRCLGCRASLAAFSYGVKFGFTNEKLAIIATFFCRKLNFGTPAVCKGVVGLNLPILSHIIKTTPEATPMTFCGLIFQEIPNSNLNMCVVKDPRFEWQVDLPEPEPDMVETIPPSTAAPLTVALITDAHLDPYYEPFGAAECGEPTCCRFGQSVSPAFTSRRNIDLSIYERSIVKTKDEVLIDLDVAPEIRGLRNASQSRFIRATTPEPAGYWGDYRNCDTPIWAFEDYIDRIAETHKDVDIVYYVGDTIDHFVWETTYELNKKMNSYVIDKIKESFGDDVLVVLAIGNHESQPINQFAPSHVTGDELNTTWLYEALADKWDFYLPEGARATVLERGEYSVLAKPGLRVITVNNNVAYRFNWWLVYDPQEAKKHLEWLVEELHQAELAGERVHILTHIPPGDPDLTLTWTREYDRIINRFASTITGEFNGHTHTDEFKIFYSPDGEPVRVAWGVGGATTYNDFNLNYKIATFDAANYEPINIVNYIYNLTEANLTPNRRPHWFQLYDLKQRFSLSDLSPASMDDLVNRMVTTNLQLLDSYAKFTSKQSDIRWPKCDEDCKLDYLCKAVTTVPWQRQKCDELRSLFYHYRYRSYN